MGAVLSGAAAAMVNSRVRLKCGKVVKGDFFATWYIDFFFVLFGVDTGLVSGWIEVDLALCKPPAPVLVTQSQSH